MTTVHRAAEVGTEGGHVVTQASSRNYAGIGPAIGTRFPDVRLPDQGGRQIDLHQARAGRPAIVVFYRSARW